MSTIRIAILSCLLFTAIPMIAAIGSYNASIRQFTYTNQTTPSATHTPQNFTRSAGVTINFSDRATARPSFVFDNFTIFVLTLVVMIGIPVVLGIYRAARKSGRALGPSMLASIVAFVVVVSLVSIVAGPMSQILIPSIRSLPTASIEVSVAAIALAIVCVGFLVWFFRRSQPKSLASEYATQKKPLEIRLLDCSHYRTAEKQSILEVDFELSNPSGYQTSIRDITAWILDGTHKLDGELESLWDYRTLARRKESYNPEKRPDLEKLQVPHLWAEPTERYVAIFRFTDAITSGEDTKCGILVIHTHGEEPCEGISHPSPLQRITGHLASETTQERERPSPKTKSAGQRRNHTEKPGLQRALTILKVILIVFSIAAAGTTAFYYWQSSQQSQKSELLGSLRYSKSILPSCNMTEQDRQRIEQSIDEAINEVELNNDIPTAQSIFDTVKGQLSNCPVPTTAVYSLSSILVLTVVLLAISLVLLAVRSRKKVPYV